MIVPDSVLLATAYSDPTKPRGTGKEEPVIWVNSYGKGRVYENVLGHDLEAMADPKYHDWLRRGVIWAAAAGVKPGSPTTYVASSRPASPAQEPQAHSALPTQVSTNPTSPAAAAQPSTAPVNVLIITGDNVSAHNWQANSKAIEDILEKDGRIKVDITATPSKDLTDENLAKYDVLLLNYKETPAGPPESRWSESNKAAFLKAVRDGQRAGGLIILPASSAFTKPNWDESSEKLQSPAAGALRASTGPRTSFPSKRPKQSIRSPMACPPSSSIRSTSCIRTR